MKRVIFKKWINPYGNRNSKEFIDEDEYFEGDGGVAVYEEEDEAERKLRVDIHGAITSQGIVPVEINNDSVEHFNIWVGHTNFPITKKIYDKIKSFPGVEIFEVNTPYRFKICVGQAFNEHEVIVPLKWSLSDKPKEEEKEKFNLPKEYHDLILNKWVELDSSCNYWILYLLPDGQLEVSKPKDDEDFSRKFAVLSAARELVGGYIFSS